MSRCCNKSSELETLVDALPEVDSESKRWPPIDRDAVLFLVDLMQWLRLFLHARAFQGLTQIVRQLALVVASLAKSVFTTKHVENASNKPCLTIVWSPSAFASDSGELTQFIKLDGLVDVRFISRIGIMSVFYIKCVGKMLLNNHSTEEPVDQYGHGINKFVTN